MSLIKVIDQVSALLRTRGRITYRVLKREFSLDDEQIEDVKEELITGQRVALDEEGRVLVWVGDAAQSSTQRSTATAKPIPHKTQSAKRQSAKARKSPTTTRRSLVAKENTREAERRQLTVQFIDLVGSTTLSQQLDPEDYHARVVAYQRACQQVIARYEGHIAQYLGDGVLVYFGYPTAHEEDAVRAVRSGLEIVTAVGELRFTPPLQVRIGIHTGPVVVGEIGAGEQAAWLALGETPNIAARVQGHAAPNTVVISNATHRLAHGFFRSEALGPQELKNVAAPLELYQVRGEGTAHTRFEVSMQRGLTALVGREPELGTLRQHWEQAKAGAGQVVSIGGEPGIGKSRLVQELKEHISIEGALCVEFRCSPYYRHSALYPIIAHLHRLLQFAREDTPAAKLEKLQRTLSHYHFPQPDTVPLLASLLSLPHPEGFPSITVSPQKQKEKMQAALVAWLVEEAEQKPVYNAWEDLHWADPSTLEVLTFLLDQVPTTRLLVTLTFRPEFLPPWGHQLHLCQLTLRRLERRHVEAMVARVTGGRTLPAEVMQQIVAKTDGVPLFVEELTKTVVESGLLTAVNDHYELRGPLPPLAIPTTLQDSLMARLDRLAPVKEIAQLGATLGREFSYELLHAVSPLDESSLQRGLRQLVEAELLYPRGLPPQATYLFKHALIQDTAYHSLLKSKRQHYHQQTARVLEAQFPDTIETQPELVAHHYTEAGLIEQAIPYWRQAGERANQHSAHVEAIGHLAQGLELLKTLPDTPERTQQELMLQIALGSPLIATKGFAAPEVEQIYTRARELCQLTGAPSHLFPTLRGLWEFYGLRAEYHTAQELGEQLLALAQHQPDPSFLLLAHNVLADTLFYLGEFRVAREHLERGEALYDVDQHRSHAFLYGYDSGVHCLSYAAWVLWFLGYPDQALKKVQAALSLARNLAHPFTFVLALHVASRLHHLRREAQAVQERAEAEIALSTEQGFAFFLAGGLMYRGWAVVEQGQGKDRIAQIHQGLDALRATGAEQQRPYYLALLAEAYGKVEEAEHGLAVLGEALAQVEKTRERYYEAELYRLKGNLLLAQGGHQGKTEDVEQCFLKAIEVARKQSAKSLELRAIMSLTRLWQQDKRAEAYQLLSETYSWFTEGFDTKDLQEAKSLLEELL